jgi:hypothetical protein
LNSEDGRRLWNDYLRMLAEYLCSGYAPLGLVRAVQSEFIVYVMPYASTLLYRIFKRYITKETWETMLSVIGGKTKTKTGGAP